MNLKRVIDMTEFQEIIERGNYDRYQYSTENQSWDDGGRVEVCRQHLTFQNIRVSPMMPGCPAVTLTGVDGSMTFLNVCKVEHDGNTFTLHCRPWENSIGSVEYSITAEKN